MTINVVSYKLVGNASFPEIGFDASPKEILGPFQVIRFITGIDQDRSCVIEEALRNASQEGQFKIAIHAPEKLKPSDLMYLSRNSFAVQKIDDLIWVKYIRADIIILKELLIMLVRQQKLFFILFKVEDLDDERIFQWEDFYGQSQARALTILKNSESILFRANMKSQDVFELSVIKR